MVARKTEDHLRLITDINEITSLLSDSPDLQGFLDRAVVMVAEHLSADVCSIYLYDEKANLLTLSATCGLSQKAVGEIQLKPGEGLVGRSLKELRPICVANASSSPDYKFFPELGEETYGAFLAIPIARGVEKIGVLVVQRDTRRTFSNTEVMTMQALTAQMATAIETARTLLQIAQLTAVSQAGAGKEDATGELFVKGRSASPGFAHARCVIFSRHPVDRILTQNRLSTKGIGTREDLENAINATAEQLKELQIGQKEKLPEVASLIFESHMMMLKDTAFTGEMFKAIDEGMPANRAVAETAGKYIATFEASAHDYMREKARDIEDVALRLLSNLPGAVEVAADRDWRESVVIMREMFPSDILKITLEDVAGIVMVSGGLTSHISILVRSLNIPMVIADDSRLLEVSNGSDVLLDAFEGNVYVSPPSEVIDRFRERNRVSEKAALSGQGMADVTHLEDGEPVALLANVNLLSELDLALELKADGIGLYRTEFPFLIRQALPTEDDQYLVYRQLFTRMRGHDITMRTLDAGGDKVLSYFDDAGEPNPALGLRSTRLTLRYREIFDQQLRAILRAGADSDSLRVMFPMIASLDEFIQARERVYECAADLEKEGFGPIPRPSVGMMVELPAVLEIIDDFAMEADFFSIGTNDFIQYMLAVDRTNQRVADYYCPHHPSVLRGLKRIADAALRHDKQCAVCGEMAHDCRYVPFFLGIGIRRLSVDPHYLPDVQACIMKWSSERAEAYAESLLSKTLVKDIEPLLN